MQTKRKKIVAALVATTLAVAGTATGLVLSDTPTPPAAWVYSCTPYMPNGVTLYPKGFDFYPIQFAGSVQEANDWVTSHKYPDTGCWTIKYVAPQTTTTTTTSTSTTTTTTLPPTTTTTSTSTTTTTNPPPSTTTTTNPPWPTLCLKVCQQYYTKYCSLHPTNHTKFCAHINGLPPTKT